MNNQIGGTQWGPTVVSALVTAIARAVEANLITAEEGRKWLLLQSPVAREACETKCECRKSA